MADQQLLRLLVVGGNDLHDLPQAGGNVGREQAAQAVELSRADLALAGQAGEDRMHLDDAEGGKVVAGAGIGQQGIDLGSAQLGPVMLDGRAGVKESFGHPWPLSCG